VYLIEAGERKVEQSTSIQNGKPYNFYNSALEKNILLPKKENLREVYDDILGTDKWLIDKR
jgi:hypothetical protein